MLQLINKPTKEVGETYCQYPGERSPGELFGGTWTALFENEGVFFRTPGNHASSFNGGLQESSNKAHGHSRGNMEISGTAQFGTSLSLRGHGSGSFYPDGTGTVDSHGAGAVHATGLRLGFLASRTWSGVTSSDGTSEARPRNRTFRVWRRVS